jgi:GNAT superfamily N-acetyltransferase
MKKPRARRNPRSEATSPSDRASIAQYAVRVPAELESAEFAAFLDLLGASPELTEVAEIGGAICALVRGLEEARMFNRVLNLTSTEPLDGIGAFYGEVPWWVSDSHGLGRQLEDRGFVRDYGWMKFSRGIRPRQAQSDLHVVRIESDRARDFGNVVTGGYGMPEWTGPLAANIVGRPCWSCYVAYEGESPAGAGALFVHEGIGWLGFGATLPEFRGRGAQSVILAARIEDARQQGCSRVVTETGELAEGRPSSSYRNILRAGFREAGVRPNYRAPSPAA